MSANTDLSAAFGRPAKSLSDRLPPNPRRSRRDGEPSGTGDDRRYGPGSPADQSDHDAGPGTRTAMRATAQAPTADQAPQGRATEATATEATATEATEAGPTPPAPAPPASTQPAPPERTTRSRRQPATKTRPLGTRSPSPDTDPDTSYQIGVYVRPSTRSAAATRRKADNLTNAEIVFDAIDEVQHRLDRLINDSRLEARPESSLFPGRRRRHRPSTGGVASGDRDVRRVLWQFRVTGAELDVIDRLAARCRAESRSELVAVALEACLEA